MSPITRFCGAAAWARLPQAVRDRVGALLLEVVACAHLAQAAERASWPALENLADEAQGGLLDRIDDEILDKAFTSDAIPLPSVFGEWCERLMACPQAEDCCGGSTLRCAGRCGVARPPSARLDA